MNKPKDRIENAVNKALSALVHVAHQSKHYEHYDEADIVKIENAITEHTAAAISELRNPSTCTQFKL